MPALKLIIFDLDGVLVDSRPLHYSALNEALSIVDPHCVITQQEHLSTYDGLPTTTKLQLLSKKKGLSPELYSTIWKIKQEQTLNLIKTYIKPREEHIRLLQELKAHGYLLCCASNSVWNTVKTMLIAAQLIEYIDYFASNEDIHLPKPSPQIYFHCMSRFNCSTQETLICEDSPIGRLSALASGACVCVIENPDDLTRDKIMTTIQQHAKLYENDAIDLRWKGPLNIVIPMAGNGSRFKTEGYLLPKPLIDVDGKPMIQRVVDNLNLNATYIFIVQEEHIRLYDLETKLRNLVTGQFHIVSLSAVTEGAACTVLKAKHLINNDTPLLIANSDQYVEWSSNQFMYCASGADGAILTFQDPERSNKWSFVKTDDNGWVSDVKEKQPISDIATVGIYHWAKGSDFVRNAEQMISANDRVNREFYIAPVYNYGIVEGKKYKTHDCKRMWGLGTPQDLQYFLSKKIFSAQ
jgi:HAD superfamily hydrolase (TIGR01509 family)